ncbi:uncharacterized protein LOC108679063 isoform X2 [Hyalella azteca]|uniref:Uncharacterized protein LOC108679063 isoform X2 n=1 Tax=Hyalella azteca TaxID=294128 RepID=A0A8B7PBJ1_HYAAZ|nr:uncharacterized protein LOC108679063 isoform X2 [Hyalella azteca]
MVPDECVLRNMDSRDTNSTDEPKVDSVVIQNVENERNQTQEGDENVPPQALSALGDEGSSGSGNASSHDNEEQNIQHAETVEQNLEEVPGKNASESESESENLEIAVPDETGDVENLNNLSENNVEDKNTLNEDSPNVFLKIPQARLVSNVDSAIPPYKNTSVQNGPENIVVDDVADDAKDPVINTSPATPSDVPKDEPKSGLSSRRASYIDVVGLSADEQSAEAEAANHVPVSPDTLCKEDSEDKDFSEDEDKLVIHEGSSERKPDEDDDKKKVGMYAVKRSSDTSNEETEDDQHPKKKARLKEVSAEVINLTCDDRKENKISQNSASNSSVQVDLLLAQVNKEIEVLEKQVRIKEEEWNGLLRSLKEKEELAARLRRKSEVLRFQGGTGDLPSTFSPGGHKINKDASPSGLLAALTSGASSLTSHTNSYDSTNPIAMMSRLLSNSIRPNNNSHSGNDQQGSSRSNTSSPSVSIIDIHTRTSSPTVSMHPDIASSLSSSLTNSHSTNRFSNANLPENLRNKLTRQLLNAAGATKPILPKPHHVAGSNGSGILSSLAGQNPAPQTLASMLSAGPNGSLLAPGGRDMSGNSGMLGNSGSLQATGYGPQGPTISVQQLIDAHRKDNPATPPVRGAKRGAWRHKYDNGGSKRGIRGDGNDRSSSLTLSDPTVSYNDVLLQFAQLTQQQNAEKNGPGSPQISIIPVSDTGSGNTSGQSYGVGSNHSSSLSGGLSVTPTSNKHSHSSMLEGTSALAKLLMESRSNTKQNALLEHQQQQQIGGGGVSNSQYLTLSALLSGGTTTTVREKAAAAAAAAAAANALSAHQSGENRNKKTEGGLVDPNTPNPKCQGCHKERAQFVCAGCGNQWYCSRECQVAAWDEHSERCNT